MSISLRKYLPLSCFSLKSISLGLLFGIFFLLTGSTVTYPQTPPHEVNLYEQGLEEKKNGNITKALEIWNQSQAILDEPDFRIAYEYLKLVTEEEQKQYYQNATELYFWGLSGTISELEHEALLNDVSLLKPLIGNGDYQDLKQKIEEGNSQALSEIKTFWDSLDPTPLNSYNERLIEHWQRISFARENYTLPNSEELDPRGNIYLKYGEPYYTRSGQLNYNAALVNRLLLEGIQTPSFASADKINIATAQRYNMETLVRQLHEYPQYEVWIYRELTDDTQNTIFVFGNKGNSQKMNKINSIDDFIPNKAYRKISQHNYSMTTSGNSDNDSENSEVEFDAGQSRDIAENISFSPALILQLMYYDQFAAFDNYFGQSYNEMIDQYIDRSNIQGSSMSGMAREFGTMYGNKLIQMQNAAPEEKSKDQVEIISIPSENHIYRFLDENNDPYLKTFSEIDLQNALYYDLLKDGNSLQSGYSNNYTLLTGYLLKDENENNIDKKIDQKAIVSEQAVNVIEIPYEPEAQLLTLSHELHKLSEMEDSTISSNTTYAKSLKGLNNDRLDLLEPLESQELVLSDIIIGYSTGTDNPNVSEDSLNFNIAHDRVIPEESDLNLYYEIYNLEPDENDGLAEFTFHYSIHEKSESNGFLGLGIFKKDPEDEISITLNNSVSDDRYSNTLIIETSSLEEGEYELDILIEDIHSGAEYSHNVPFDIQ